MHTIDHLFIRRCFDLARLGAGQVAPNPLVGAVLVYDGRIIGEGWHQRYGQAHAEVNALGSVRAADQWKIPFSTLYVSLEPCNIHGNTPPCTDLILRSGIKKVVVSCLDHTPEVKGMGVTLLRDAGVEVVYGILEEEGKKIAAVRNTFAGKKRPFILLKFARTPNGYMGKTDRQVWISNLFSKRLSHKMRSESGAILIGTQTALTDNPQLTNRLWYGKSPLRIVLDRSLKIPPGSEVFSDGAPTWVITEITAPAAPGNTNYVTLPFDGSFPENLLQRLYEHKISSLIVEGGAFTLRQFIAKGLWDEAWVFTGSRLIEEGISAPVIDGKCAATFQLADDEVRIIENG